MRRLAVPVLMLCAATAAVWLAWPHANRDEAETGTLLTDTGVAAPVVPEPSAGQRHPWVPVSPPSWAKVNREQIEAAARYRVPVAFENHIGLRFVIIPPGTFLMGSSDDEQGRRADETQHEVTLSRPFYIQITEVTNAQFRRCDVWRVGRDHDSGGFRGHSLDGDDHPAVQVSWDTASEFARWLSHEDRPRRYVLPTEAQWESACRARAGSRFWWGAAATEGWRFANVNDARTKQSLRLMWDGWRRDDGHRVTAPVASYRPSRWGLYDMTGNVWEWCADWYGRYPSGPVVNPRGPRDGRARVLRGGSWLIGPALARSATRVRDGPSARSMNVGFRLVSPLPESSK